MSHEKNHDLETDKKLKRREYEHQLDAFPLICRPRVKWNPT